MPETRSEGRAIDKPWDDTFEVMLREALRLLPADEELRPDLSTATAGLDSLAAVELLIRIEAAYNISISEELLQLDSFATPGALWELVTAVRGTDTPAMDEWISRRSRPV